MASLLRTGLWLAIGLCAALVTAASGVCSAAEQQPANAFANPGFEMGRTSWASDTGPGTTAHFAVDADDASTGDYSVRVSMGAVGGWGLQFGQYMAGGRKGATYTFAVFAKAVGEPAQVALQVQRNGPPWDNAVDEPLRVTAQAWRELHVTFEVRDEYPEGWFAYVYCGEPNVEFRLDDFRLYEGSYVPFAEATRSQRLAAEVAVFDTGAAPGGPTDAGAVGEAAGWTKVPAGVRDHEFAGDAVLMNDRVAVAFRKGAGGAEVYSVSSGSATRRAVLVPVGDGSPVALASVAIAGNAEDRASIDATFAGADGKPVAFRCEVRMGHLDVRTEPIEGVRALRVEAPCRFAVLPDFFADDIVVDAAQMPVDRADLPGEHFLVHMLGEGGALLMAVWDKAEQDVGVVLSGSGGDRRITASEIPYSDEGSIWVAVLAGEGTWHLQEVGARDVGKVVDLAWQEPFAALWRADWRRDDGLIESWELAAETPDGTFVKHGWYGSAQILPEDRRKWNELLHWYTYPCWVGQDGRGYLQPLDSKVLRFDGPVLIYPVNRVARTPLTAYTVVDVVRATLGVGPCEYILDVEAQAPEWRGAGGCATRDLVDGIYAEGTQRERRDEIDRGLTNLMIFLTHIRGRIEQYAAFAQDLRAYLAEQTAAHPELAGPLATLDTLAAQIGANMARRKDAIKTIPYAAALVAEFRANVLDYDGPDALDRCKRLSAAWVEIAGNQDELVAQCRMHAKLLRQQAGLAVAADPRMADIAAEVRRRCQEILRNPTATEGPRH
jgi:hypothetical protein